MIIEDDMAIAQVLRNHLSKWDYESFYVNNKMQIIFISSNSSNMDIIMAVNMVNTISRDIIMKKL